MDIKNKTKTIFIALWQKIRHYRCYRLYSAQFKRYIKRHNFQNQEAIGEKEYIQKWKALSKRVEPYSYRYFCHFCGYTPNIIPEDIGHSYIEEVLNPTIHRATYGDKNLFQLIIGKEFVPHTILCRMNGSKLLDSEYKVADGDIMDYIGDETELILKPSIDASSGKGIIKFIRKGQEFVSTDNTHILSTNFLMTYNNNFCLQSAVKQHPFLNKLCKTSVNTVRLCLYRSVKNEMPIVTASVIRIGKDGSFVDNIHTGGMLIGVNTETGELGKFVVDQYGNKQTIWNGIDYENNSFVVPYWNSIISLAQYVGTRIHHHRLIALDIALTEEGKPILIEYNIKSFGFWAFMYVNQEVFGEYTDEIIEYCKTQK